MAIKRTNGNELRQNIQKYRTMMIAKNVIHLLLEKCHKLVYDNNGRHFPESKK